MDKAMASPFGGSCRRSRLMRCISRKNRTESPVKTDYCPLCLLRRHFPTPWGITLGEGEGIAAGARVSGGHLCE